MQGTKKYQKGGNEERDRRLKVVKLLTALRIKGTEGLLRPLVPGLNISTSIPI